MSGFAAVCKRLLLPEGKERALSIAPKNSFRRVGHYALMSYTPERQALLDTPA
jgi:hypothetical protein